MNCGAAFMLYQMICLFVCLFFVFSIVSDTLKYLNIIAARSQYVRKLAPSL